MSSDQLQFIDYRKPKLEAGDYVFDVQHKYGEPGGTTAQVKPSGSIKVRVGCERVSIGPDIIYGQYPPPGQSGNYADTLPHISLKKGALPWARSAYPQETEEPWLFLLVLNEADIEAQRAKKLQTLPLDSLSDGAYFPPAQLQNLKDDTTLGEQVKNIKTVDVKNSLLKKILANNKAQTKQLAHVRRRWQPESVLVKAPEAALLTKFDSNDITALVQSKDLPDSTHAISVLTKGKSWLVTDQLCGEYLVEVDENNALCRFSLKRELAVMLANRLGYVAPEQKVKGTRNFVCLVSLEHYFDERFDDETALSALGDDQYVRLIVLHDWWFNCTAATMNFAEKSGAINADSLRLPQQSITAASGFENRLQAGLTGLPHQTRLGDSTASWYRGPFAPCTVGDASQVLLSDVQLGKVDQTYSATDADKLLCYFAKDGMFDISYAAAYELGRFLSMNHVDYIKNLAAYKRGRARYIQLTEDDKVRQQASDDQGISIKHLPYAKLNEDLVA
ncbi:MAG: hypothetical protein HRT35_38460, partial [Algicola sp.]|nr:hypothetical protein [Algicola sp.]